MATAELEWGSLRRVLHEYVHRALARSLARSLGSSRVQALVGLACLLAGAIPPLPAQGKAKADPRILATDRAVTAYMKAEHIPGLSIAIVIAGALRLTKGYGLADLENDVRVTPSSLFPTASALKPLTATAVMQLAERGRLDLDAPVQRYCPGYPAKRWPVTTLDLLRHQAGVPPSSGTDVFNRLHFSSVQAIVATFAADSLQFQPGTSFVYSNDGYVLLACVIEGASGERYEDYLRKNVLAPAGMTSTQLDNGYRVIPHRARSYVVRTAQNTKDWQGLWTAAHLTDLAVDVPANADPVDPTSEWGAAGYVTSPTDLARFAIAWMSGRLLSDSTRARMAAEQKTRSDSATHFGLGWQVASLAGHPTLGIFGSVWSGSSALLVVPSERFAVAICSNREFLIPHELAEKIAAIWGVPAKP